ncbi:MAG TPA: ATP-binding protein [Polyangia bacterium]|nr:ATP-binding protein [Polyangia bacterium]
MVPISRRPSSQKCLLPDVDCPILKKPPGIVGRERRSGLSSDPPRFAALLEAALEAAPDAMVITDRGGHIVHVNAQAEALFGYPRDELLGRTVEMLIPQRYRAAHPPHRNRYFAEPRTRGMGAGHLALFGLRRDGSEFPAEISLSPLETEDGLLAITAIRDVADRKRAEDERAKLYQAQEAIRMRDEFLSIASHELRTPLSAVQMQLDGILRIAQRSPENELTERIITKTEATQRAIQRLNRLVGQLLELSRITAGRLTLQREEIDLCMLVGSTVALFRDELERAGCELRVHLPTEPVVGSWDSLRVEQIISNLLSNAIKYGRGHPIELTLGASGDSVSLAVRDHGIGIAPADQTRIFERFERVVSQRNYGGFGLGLWIVRQIIEAHGGSIRVWSQPGAGSSFTVELPRGPHQLPAVVAATGRPNRDRKRILLVDDDEMIRASFAEAIADEGIEVAAAGDGREALHMLRCGVAPDVIFLDLMMPVMDGQSFRAEQLKDPALASIPVVLFSAAGNVDQQAEALGVSAYLKKPLNLGTVLELIDRLG